MKGVVRTHTLNFRAVNSTRNYGGLPESFNTQNTIIYQRFFTKSETDYEELGDST